MSVETVEAVVTQVGVTVAVPRMRSRPEVEPWSEWASGWASSDTASPEWLAAADEESAWSAWVEEYHHGESDLGSDCDLLGNVLEVDRPVALVALVRGR
jgi:hypothetical protein